MDLVLDLVYVKTSFSVALLNSVQNLSPYCFLVFNLRDSKVYPVFKLIQHAS